MRGRRSGERPVSSRCRTSRRAQSADGGPLLGRRARGVVPERPEPAPEGRAELLWTLLGRGRFGRCCVVRRTEPAGVPQVDVEPFDLLDQQEDGSARGPDLVPAVVQQTVPPGPQDLELLFVQPLRGPELTPPLARDDPRVRRGRSRPSSGLIRMLARRPVPTRSSSLRRLIAQAAAAALLVMPIAGAAALAAAAATGPAAQVRGLLLHQVDLFNQSRWRPLWLTYTPRFRSRCPYRRFVALETRARSAVGRFSIRKIAVRVTRARAAVSYDLLARGVVIDRATTSRPDVYVRISGRWYDEVDSHTGPGC